MAEEDYAKQIAKILESDKVRFSSVIYGEYRSKVHGKSLDNVLSHQRVVLIVEDKAEVWVTEDRGNVIKIKPYTFFNKEGANVSDNEDQELARIWSILKTIHTKFFDKKNENYYDSKDVRQLLRKS
ncbi:RNA polymerase II C-terminal domain phosphatase-like 5 [Silene latifolia]|uniref:RNA polymerase II C-terminal domain phosphatase-like 5 n=1 Tax=Silene latifolia TaxID=37657 RepID=UPI003D76A606